MDRRAEMGVGTLIIFISLLLVAAVAAGVLIQTAGSLQQRALMTGAQATGQISTNAIVLEISASDATTGDGVDDFSSIMKLAPGSDAIKLDEVTLSLSTSNTTQTLTYSGNSTFNTTHFGVSYLQTGSGAADGVMVRGDVIKIDFTSAREIGEGEQVRINFIPKIGTATLSIFDMPDVMSTQRVYLYP
jgi:archaeal flagellin FlaB